MAKIEHYWISFSFEDLKMEFRTMEVEIKDKDIIQLRQAVIENTEMVEC